MIQEHCLNLVGNPNVRQKSGRKQEGIVLYNRAHNQPDMIIRLLKGRNYERYNKLMANKLSRSHEYSCLLFSFKGRTILPVTQSRFGLHLILPQLGREVGVPAGSFLMRANNTQTALKSLGDVSTI